METIGKRNVFFSEAQDTDLTLSERNYSVHKKILEKWRETNARPPYTLKNGKAVERNGDLPVQLNGQFQYVVYSRKEAGEIDINIGSGAHYLIGEGRGKAIIAGEIEFSEGVPVRIENGSGTYHYNYTLGNGEKLTNIYRAQEALKSLKLT